MGKKRDYETDVKVKLIELGYSIVSKNEEYLNTHSILKFKCDNCGETFDRSSKSAFKCNPQCTKCIQKIVVGKKLSMSKFNRELFIENYKGKLKNLEIITKGKNNVYVKYNCLECNKSITRRAYEVEKNLYSELCTKCARAKPSDDKRKNKDDINNELLRMGSKTICVDNDIKNNKHKTLFKCDCGRLFKRKYNVISTTGYDRCSFCSNTISKPELKIMNFLEKNDIQYEYQKKFKDCKNVLILPFDFYIESKNLIIEYDGEHHFYNFRGDENFNRTKRTDSIKNKYCEDKNINILRIPYYEYENIEEIITNYMAIPSQVV